jgi:hypothetical protein
MSGTGTLFAIYIYITFHLHLKISKHQFIFAHITVSNCSRHKCLGPAGQANSLRIKADQYIVIM